MRDPIVEEVRNRRVEHCKEFDNDLAAIYADLKSTEADLGGTIVKRPARHLEKKRKVFATG